MSFHPRGQQREHHQRERHRHQRTQLHDPDQRRGRLIGQLVDEPEQVDLRAAAGEHDGLESDVANQSVYLTSVLKNMDVTTFNAIKSVVDGTFEGGVTVGTLANDGVGLAPYHDFDATVPQALKDQIDKIKAGIIDGSISVKG